MIDETANRCFAKVQEQLFGWHGRIYSGHPRPSYIRAAKDVDARDKPGHDESIAPRNDDVPNLVVPAQAGTQTPCGSIGDQT
jgi:hypothetical protein